MNCFLAQKDVAKKYNSEDYKIELIYVQTGTTERPGGQHAGSPATKIRVTHLETELVAECGICRSQHKNVQLCMEMIEWGLTNFSG